jgi:hypothetical protein
LQRWDVALSAWTEKAAVSSQDVDATMGTLRCHHALGNWDSLSSLSKAAWVPASNISLSFHLQQLTSFMHQTNSKYYQTKNGSPGSWCSLASWTMGSHG